MYNVLQPIDINQLRLPNRFIRSATYEGLATAKGMATDELARLYGELGAGSLGLIVVGYAAVQPNGIGGPGMLGIWSDEHIAGFARLTQAVHESGGLVCAQIVHCGRQAFPELIEGPPVGPSAVPTKKFGATPRELTQPEIQRLVLDFGAAAARAKKAGFDAVQIHCAHGYLLNQFLARNSNRRTDGYGGDLPARARILFETYEEIRRSVGAGYPVLIKLNCRDFVEDGLELDESMWVARRLSEMGMDAIEISGGIWDTTLEEGKSIQKGIPRKRPEAYFLQYAQQFAGALSVPVITVGGIRSVETAESIVAEGKAAMVSLCRPLICEPHLVKRWLEGDRAPAQCVSCNRCLALTASRGLQCFKKKPASATAERG
ncbi:MAG: NADH:flavin oxidoreductase [Candidatus Abyssobacteria bacterium SURF_5]|uniref:NADH:flavin oxidoreductase n=1 Tax=Abyssobacteria bacterium (strain SURF_5) TaxID=2093360 RepID=A0A3A4P6F0_ABYX5|nr:MAG: NADH:flavin oxidoreductase [Candidatus Abyssubacteria bacterium SURF_5]